MTLLLLMLTITVSLFPCAPHQWASLLGPMVSADWKLSGASIGLQSGGCVEQYPGAPITATMSSCSHAMAASFLHVIAQPVYICQAFYKSCAASKGCWFFFNCFEGSF